MRQVHLPIRAAGRRRRTGAATLAAGAVLVALLPASVLGGSSSASAEGRSSGQPVRAETPSGGEVTARPAARRNRNWRFVSGERFKRFDAGRWDRYSGRPSCCADTTWDPRMVTVRNGRLQLHTGPRNGRWLSGGVGGYGWEKAERTYGRWDARIRFDRGAGVSAAALLWPSGSGWPPELDFYEIFHTWGDRSRMMVTTHWRQQGQHRRSQRAVRRDFTKWHVASVRWRPGRVSYWLDGKRIKLETNAARVPRSRMWLGFQTHAHRMNGRYRPLPQGKSSVALEVDWVRVYRPNR